MQTIKNKKIIAGQAASNLIAIMFFIALIATIVIWSLFINTLQRKYNLETTMILANPQKLSSADMLKLNNLNTMLISFLILYVFSVLISIIFSAFIATFSYKFNWKATFILALGAIFLTRVLGVVSAFVFYKNEKTYLNEQNE
ncbi:hypothetical protein [Mycoplasma phocoeninasale]|uniref:Uncharacterized protein n=1 Tax=Mycoplasma phocoeninasale TaxID=2726117 RepID=A0A858U774_9MOLU|nr:hypothetical protein [Mycoplasma phocoeninasale]MBN0970915.1 hypothetical protein [Mycoplasma phocoeninasale]QJG66576.1 hypothetical protein HGG64_02585 [Mycoplasma phocoeninasale]